MLILYVVGLGSASDIRLNEDDEGPIPPPISLSAPELGAIVPQMEGLKFSASSSELLHERAMMRFYQNALAEEAEREKSLQNTNHDRKPSVEIPKIQINSKDEEDIVGLERKHSLMRRFSAGSTTPFNNVLWAQRRRSLKLSSDISDIVDNSMQKGKLTAQDKRELMLKRERSASEELEEQEFEKVRERMKLEKQNSAEKRDIQVVREEKWDVESNDEEEYEESVSEETESSEDERFKEYSPRKPHFEEEEAEEEPYHPGLLKNADDDKTKYELPFEILTKPNALPDPNFVPKPILKKRDYDEPLIVPPAAPIMKRKEPKLRGMEEKEALDMIQRNRSLSLTEGDDHITVRQRSFSLVPSPIDNIPPAVRKGSTSSANPQVIQAVAEISGITAAGVVIPEPLLNKKKSEEEAKVVADHYGDIVKSYGQRKKGSAQVYTDTDSLKKAAELQENATAELSETESAAHATPQENRSVSGSKEEVAQIRPTTTDVISATYQNAGSQVNERIMRTRTSLAEFTRKKTENRSSSQSPHRFRKSQSRTPSKSPVRVDNWTTLKNSRELDSSSPSPEYSRNRPRKQRTPNSSLSPARKARPMLKEIMTQTSVGLEIHPDDSRTSTSSVLKQEQIVAAAKVRTFMDYTTDLAMLAVACWLYLFSNELLALPVLLVMVYRQLKDEMKKLLPELMPKKYKDKNN